MVKKGGWLSKSKDLPIVASGYYWLAVPVVRLSKLLEKIRTKKRLVKMTREARHFVDEAALVRIFSSNLDNQTTGTASQIRKTRGS